MHAPTTAAELARLLDENQAGPRRHFIPVGGRTALHYGQPVRADAEQISLAEIKRVVDYPARDMTITVDAGLRVSELQELLATEGQRLPIDVPLANRATIGGIVATNTSGPGRFGHGTLRDYVIGISAVDARGRLFSAGGRVVKNVAGYDICKLLVGSLGTLAVITRVTFKLRPVAESRVAVWCPLETFDQVDHAFKARARADWDLQRDRSDVQLVTHLVHHAVEVRSGAVHLVDERNTGHLVPLHLAVDGQRLALDAAH